MPPLGHARCARSHGCACATPLCAGEPLATPAARRRRRCPLKWAGAELYPVGSTYAAAFGTAPRSTQARAAAWDGADRGLGARAQRCSAFAHTDLQARGARRRAALPAPRRSLPPAADAPRQVPRGQRGVGPRRRGARARRCGEGAGAFTEALKTLLPRAHGLHVGRRGGSPKHAAARTADAPRPRAPPGAPPADERRLPGAPVLHRRAARAGRGAVRR